MSGSFMQCFSVEISIEVAVTSKHMIKSGSHLVSVVCGQEKQRGELGRNRLTEKKNIGIKREKHHMQLMSRIRRAVHLNVANDLCECMYVFRCFDSDQHPFLFHGTYTHDRITVPYFGARVYSSHIHTNHSFFLNTLLSQPAFCQYLENQIIQSLDFPDPIKIPIGFESINVVFVCFSFHHRTDIVCHYHGHSIQMFCCMCMCVCVMTCHFLLIY